MSIRFFQAEDGIRDADVTGVQTCALPIYQMELTAPIEALKYVKKINTQGSPVEIFSDSKYVILGITEWIFNWQKNNWRNAAKKPVLNRELWEELFELTQEFNPKWNYVKGHNGDKYNERVDLIATSFAEGEPVELKK